MRARKLLREHSGGLSIVLRLLDALIVLATGIALYAWRYSDWSIPSYYREAFLLVTVAVFAAFPAFGVYSTWRMGQFKDALRRLTLAWAFVATCLIVAGFMVKTSALYSRLWMGLWWASAWAAMLFVRAALRYVFHLVRMKGWNCRRIVIVGAGELGRHVARRIQRDPWRDLVVTGFVDDKPALAGSVLDGVPIMGTASELSALLEKEPIDEVWLALPLRAEQRVKEILYDLRHSTVAVRFVPDIFGFRLLNHAITEVAGIPVLDLNVSPMVGVNRLLKAVEDFILAVMILVLVSPLILLATIGIKLSSQGPVLFRQLRHGWNGKPFTIYKFRTMIPHLEPDGTITQAKEKDPRVTTFGALLRRTNLDELPQFINVLQGRMSIVGPRPHPIELDSRYLEVIDAYMQRHKVKPGITGWAQVNGLRGETDTLEKMKKRIEYDLYYIENWSIWLDIRIIALTVLRGFGDENAY
jgi:putative colanic acid biosynthesis UDP-glucose lipid carrier transferase